MQNPVIEKDKEFRELQANSFLPINAFS